ncbi:MAG: thioredoxin family protein [Candidatus Accumulibacter sp.]|jgi:thiol-disulfide isomerase/thioredoxin|nr:thioredoxin family protein [Accumulibacter sp.]
MKRRGAADFLVVCLCAEWCKSCREYRPDFDALSASVEGADFRWVDIEEHADAMGELDIVDFPTLLVFRGEYVLFFGPMTPHSERLRRLLETFAAQTTSESRDYATSSPDRAAWQTNGDLSGIRRRETGDR